MLSGVSAVASLLIVQRGPAVLWNSIMSSAAPFDSETRLACPALLRGAGHGHGLIAGLSPALDSLRPRVSESLKGSSGAVTTGRRRSRLRGALVAVQIALSLLLLVQVVLFTKAQRRYLLLRPRIRDTTGPQRDVRLGVGGFTPPVSFYEEVESRVSAVPGVVQTSFASIAPWSGRNSTTGARE